MEHQQYLLDRHIEKDFHRVGKEIRTLLVLTQAELAEVVN